MINNNKFTENLTKANIGLLHDIPAGIHPEDSNIELWADRATRKVFFNQNGMTLPFKRLPHKYHVKLNLQLEKDPIAFKQLSKEYPNIINRLEAYAFCLYGASDANPDFFGHELTRSENFKCQSGAQCKCLKWKSKYISINGSPLTKREIEVLDLIGKGYADKQIAYLLEISQSTLDVHKQHLNKKAGVGSKQELVIKAAAEKIIQ